MINFDALKAIETQVLGKMDERGPTLEYPEQVHAWATVALAQQLRRFNDAYFVPNPNYIESLGKTKLSGVIYRAPGFMSADRNYASRSLAEFLLEHYEIRPK